MTADDLAGDLGARAVARCDLMGAPPYSEQAGQLVRRFLTSAHASALETLAAWMVATGMSVRRDGAANLIGRYEARRRPAAAVRDRGDRLR